ncbi:MobC family plasmid mobilization relaxosome protein [Christensenellaceae bacterium OttesenSCG-928-K19]|nr:MobC family plasmid mobilization relaxosome protein [Christensenellaceae bacterium OttesenSCG-928-K19]
MLKRNNQVKTRLNDEEYFRLHRLAQMSGCTVSAFIRRCCLDEKRHIIIDREISCQIYNEMNAIGRNINQLARVANITKKFLMKKYYRFWTGNRSCAGLWIGVLEE